MKFRLNAGAEIDVLTAKELKHEMDQLRRGIIEGLRPQVPIIRNPSASGVTDANGELSLVLGAPNLDRRWDVRRLVISGIDPTTAVTGTVTVYRESPNGNRLIDQTTEIPNVGVWDTNQLPLKPFENLLMVLTGAAADTTLIASAVAIDTAESEPTLVVD